MIPFLPIGFRLSDETIRALADVVIDYVRSGKDRDVKCEQRQTKVGGPDGQEEKRKPR